MATIWGSATGSDAANVNVWANITETSVEVGNNRSYVVIDWYTQMKPGQTASTYDNQARATFLVNGGYVKNNAVTPVDYRDSKLTTLAHWEGYVGHDGNGNASVTISGSFTVNSSYRSGGSISGSVGLTVIWSGATAPNTLNRDRDIFENSIYISWSGQAGGVNNWINSYEVHYVTNDGSGWSGENTFGTGGTAGATIDTTSWPRGRQFKYYVKLYTNKGDNPNSGYSAVSTKNRKPNTIPGTPTTDKSVYKVGDTIALTFTPNATPDPDGNIDFYQCKMQDSNGVDYNSGQIMGTADEGGSTVNVITTGWTPGKKWRLLVRGVDDFGIVGDWSVASAYFMMGVAMKLAIGGVIKDTGDNYLVIGGVLKTLGEAYEVVEVAGTKTLKMLG